MKFGLEIELIIEKEKLFTALEEHNIDYVYIDAVKCFKQKVLVIKKETTIGDVNAIELNFPPSKDYKLIRQVLEVLKKLNIKFNEKCALHVHIDCITKQRKDLKLIHSYYLQHQEEIIAEAEAEELYLNLNKPVCENDCYILGRRKNLNILNAYIDHRTVEHRIYKATINYEDVVWCIEQTLSIVANAFK